MATVDFTEEELRKEIWKPCPGYEGVYSISNLGRVRRDVRSKSTPKSGILKAVRDRDGYVQVGLSWAGKAKTGHVHRLVALAFLGAPPEGRKQVNHIDHDRANNRLSNLEWCSPRENMQHCIAADRHKRGMRQKDAKLTDDDIPIIRYMLERGIVLEDIARCFGIRITTVWQIKIGRTWRHVKQPEKVGLFD